MPTQLPQLPPVVAALSARLSQIGFERTRRAVAALALSMFFSLYLLLSLNAPEGFGRVFLALAGLYGVAFVGVVAEWFWGRWFAQGLAWSGVMIAIFAMISIGWAPALAIYGGIHLLVLVPLMGKKMAARYDLQEAWREKYKMDDFGVARLQKAITRSAMSLPSLIIWALAPKDGDQALVTVGGLAALALAAFGVRGLIKMRSWGVLALGGAAVLVASLSDIARLGFASAPACKCLAMDWAPSAAAALAFVCLTVAVVPFAGSVVRYLRRSV
jgi:hypothetical protein